MRIALIGATGQLGSDLLPRLHAAGHDVLPLGHTDIEISDAERVASRLEPLQPQLVINTAAYNLVDKAEDEPDVAYAVNGLGPRNLARFCEQQAVALLQISSDYVFGLEGYDTRQGYRESDLPGPMGAYGLSKLAGEYFVRSECSRSFVVRTCGLYGVTALRGKGKGNFVETMLRLGRERKQLRVVNDQHCTPTSTADLSDALTRLIETDSYGLYHATNEGQTTWCELAREIFQRTQMDVEVIPITTAEYGTKARRPEFSVLNCGKLAAILGTPLPDWHDALSRYLRARG